MPSRVEAPANRPATYSITREGLTVWHGGKAVLVIDRRGFDGLLLRLMVAKMEGGQ